MALKRRAPAPTATFGGTARLQPDIAADVPRTRLGDLLVTNGWATREAVENAVERAPSRRLSRCSAGATTVTAALAMARSRRDLVQCRYAGTKRRAWANRRVALPHRSLARLASAKTQAPAICRAR